MATSTAAARSNAVCGMIAIIPERAERADAPADVGPDLLRVAAITPFTTIDFPGKLSAVAFVQGCPWRCTYCHNPWMQPRAFDASLAHESWASLKALLSRRKGLLDGKAPPEDAVLYDAVTGKRHSAEGFLASFAAVRAAGIPFECRTTAHPSYLPEEKLLELADWLKRQAVETFALQIYRRPPGTFFATLPRVDADYPSERTRAAFKSAVGRYIERRD